MDIDDEIKKIAGIWGIDFYGVSDLAPAREAILAQGGPVTASYPRAVSAGIRLLDTIVDQLPNASERAVAINYRHHGYDLVNQRLDLFISRVSGLIQRGGHKALPVPASRRVDNERICGLFSHKLAAHQAGLGWIGKNCLLITPEAGPRVRWASVLTDAPLQVTGKPMDERCGTCSQCVEICPVKAFTGMAFIESDTREKRFDAAKCDRYFEAKRKKDAETAVCGLCLYICPHGKKGYSGESAS
jgi:epoxyqueuosine reductase QueG